MGGNHDIKGLNPRQAIRDIYIFVVTVIICFKYFICDEAVVAPGVDLVKAVRHH